MAYLIDKARTLSPGVPNLAFEVGDGTALQFKEARFDVVILLAEYVLVETDYSETSHLKQRTLGPMEVEGPAFVSVERPAGKRKRPGEYPDGTRLRFGG